MDDNIRDDFLEGLRKEERRQRNAAWLEARRQKLERNTIEAREQITRGEAPSLGRLKGQSPFTIKAYRDAYASLGQHEEVTALDMELERKKELRRPHREEFWVKVREVREQRT
jgi:hypothetical protein